MAPLLSYFVQFDLEKGSQTKYELKKHLKQVRRGSQGFISQSSDFDYLLLAAEIWNKSTAVPISFFSFIWNRSAEESSLGKEKRWRGKKNERNQIKLN